MAAALWGIERENKLPPALNFGIKKK